MSQRRNEVVIDDDGSMSQRISESRPSPPILHKSLQKTAINFSRGGCSRLGNLWHKEIISMLRKQSCLAARERAATFLGRGGSVVVFGVFVRLRERTCKRRGLRLLERV